MDITYYILGIVSILVLKIIFTIATLKTQDQRKYTIGIILLVNILIGAISVLGIYTVDHISWVYGSYYRYYDYDTLVYVRILLFLVTAIEVIAYKAAIKGTKIGNVLATSLSSTGGGAILVMLLLSEIM